MVLQSVQGISLPNIENYFNLMSKIKKLFCLLQKWAIKRYYDSYLI